MTGFDDEIGDDLVEDANGFRERICVVAVGVEEAAYWFTESPPKGSKWIQ